MTAVQRYRKKPVEIEAMQLQDDLRQVRDVALWIAENGGIYSEPFLSTPDHALSILTLEGDMKAAVGDWIIRGVEGEFYPCKPSVFEATYEPVVAAVQET